MPAYRTSAIHALAALAGAGMALFGLFGTLVALIDGHSGASVKGPPFSIWKRLLLAAPEAFLLACGAWLFVAMVLADLRARNRHRPNGFPLELGQPQAPSTDQKK